MAIWMEGEEDGGWMEDLILYVKMIHVQISTLNGSIQGFDADLRNDLKHSTTKHRFFGSQRKKIDAKRFRVV